MMRSIVIHMLIIILCALIIGIVVNSFYSKGIHFRQLLLAFPQSCSGKFTSIHPDSALILMFEDDAVFFDIRPEKKYKDDHIPNAISIPYEMFIRHPVIPPEIPRQLPWIIYDQRSRGKKLEFVIKRIKTREKKDIIFLDGGYGIWYEKQYPRE